MSAVTYGKLRSLAEKLERERIIARERVEELRKNIYFGPEPSAGN
jgi:hypothetical protein